MSLDSIPQGFAENSLLFCDFRTIARSLNGKPGLFSTADRRLPAFDDEVMSRGETSLALEHCVH